MKSVVLVSFLMAGLALSKPVDKSVFVIETEVDVSTVTLTPGDGQQMGGVNVVWAGAGSTTQPTSGIASSTTPTFNGFDPSSTTQAPISPSGVSTATTAVLTSPAPAAGSGGAGGVAPSANESSSYAKSVLAQHNNHRANHSVGALTWDDNLANIAQQIAKSCVYAHNTQAGGGGYGQNIGAGSQPNAVPALITNTMYNGEIGFFPLPYGQAQPPMDQFESWGHFSQIVWKSTTRVGCATADCSSGGLANALSGVIPWFTVCNYGPPGNFDGEYGANILQPLGDPVVVIPS